MTFKDIIGQSFLKTKLIQDVDTGRVSHAQLFVGKQGVGGLPMAIAYADYLDRRKYPRESINFALGTLQGTPYDTRSYGYDMREETSQGPSVYGQAIGGLGALGSAFAMRGS